MNQIDPQAWLADALARLPDMPLSRNDDASALGLEIKPPRRGCMIMQLNKVHSVKTFERVAAELGETVDRLFDLAIDMETEDGVI